jgi:hypothetical protein
VFPSALLDAEMAACAQELFGVSGLAGGR